MAIYDIEEIREAEAEVEALWDSIEELNIAELILLTDTLVFIRHLEETCFHHPLS
jgi:hypothetical protein